VGDGGFKEFRIFDNDLVALVLERVLGDILLGDGEDKAGRLGAIGGGAINSAEFARVGAKLRGGYAHERQREQGNE
jgi:hypothetical protein